MAYSVDILNRRSKGFILWSPGKAFTTAPELILGTYEKGAEGTFKQLVQQPLTTSPETPGLWSLDLKSISPKLPDGVYHYKFKVGNDTVTDPFAFAVDYTHVGHRTGSVQPHAVIKCRDGKLWPCDFQGAETTPPPKPGLEKLPANNHLVIYELPTTWAKSGTDERGVDYDVGTFADVRALFDTKTHGARFASVAAVRNEAILAELGVNALELLPAADARAKGEWGYATAHYFAPDFDLGPASDLVSLVETIQSQNVRFFTDVVMAFGHDSYGTIDFDTFHIRPWEERENPDSYQSHADGVLRDGWGGMLWRYIKTTEAYDPVTGQVDTVHPSWAFHEAHLARWMSDFGVQGLRLDSINNVANWDFIRGYKERAWELFNARYDGRGDPSKFLVIGEELSMPVSMVQEGVVDALWNEPWQARLRAVIVGDASNDNFEWTVRKLVNCTLDNLNPGFTDGAQAVNYITSHDIEGGDHKNRLYNFCVNKGIWDIEKRAKLAFALLLTSVGIPMIFAGEEFADQEDRSVDMSKKQTDPVNYERKNDGGWRQALFGYVARLVKFRTTCPALGVDDTDFFHVDHSRGARIMAWTRGGLGQDPVVVVANFSDHATDGNEYKIPNWPNKTKPGWREVTQDRDVPPEWVAREPLMAWEAKVYSCWK